MYLLYVLLAIKFHIPTRVLQSMKINNFKLKINIFLYILFYICSFYSSYQVKPSHLSIQFFKTQSFNEYPIHLNDGH